MNPANYRENAEEYGNAGTVHREHFFLRERRPHLEKFLDGLHHESFHTGRVLSIRYPAARRTHFHDHRLRTVALYSPSCRSSFGKLRGPSWAPSKIAVSVWFGVRNGNEREQLVRHRP
jgi:hypothetical protein